MTELPATNCEILERCQQIFQELAEEEQRRSPDKCRDPFDSDNPRDRWLRVYASLSQDQGSAGIVRLVFHLSAGLDDYFRERYIAAATDVGVALGFPRNVAFEKFLALVIQYAAERLSEWWHKQPESLWLPAKKKRSRKSAPANGDRGRRIDVDATGRLDCLCLASAASCVRLLQRIKAGTLAPEQLEVTPSIVSTLEKEPAEKGDQAKTLPKGFIHGKSIKWNAWYTKLEAEQRKYVFQEFPKWKYHPDQDACIVQNHNEELALGPDWYDSPTQALEASLKQKSEQESAAREQVRQRMWAPWKWVLNRYFREQSRQEVQKDFVRKPRKKREQPPFNPLPNDWIATLVYGSWNGSAEEFRKLLYEYKKPPLPEWENWWENRRKASQGHGGAIGKFRNRMKSKLIEAAKIFR
jgi:hypothetical protein